MFVVHKNKVCVMVWDIEKGKYVYISERKWDKMNDSQLRRYKLTHLDHVCITSKSKYLVNA